MTTYWDVRSTESNPTQPKEEIPVEQKQETPQTDESVSTIEATVETVIETPTETGVETTSVVESETDYIGKRLMAYRQNSLDMEDIQELVMEYIAAFAAEDIQVAAKYKTLLSEVHNKRQSIKQQFPKS